MKRCAICGEADTGWRAEYRSGQRVCPACAQGVKRCDPAEMLAERRALLARIEAEEPFPGLERFKAKVQCGIDGLEKRIEDERKHQSAGDCGF